MPFALQPTSDSKASSEVDTPSTLCEADASLSSPITSSEVQAHGSFTIFPARRPHNLQPFEKARDEIRALWEEYMQDGLIKTNMCTECPVVGDYLGVAYPGTRPERIKPFVWLYVIFFLLDDKAEYMTREEAQKVHIRIKRIIESEATLTPETPLERLFTLVIKAFISVNRSQAIFALSTWVNWLENTQERDISSFTSLEEFLPYRLNNFGFPPMSAMAAYGSGIDITAEEVAMLEGKLRPTGLACTLTNDYWSFPKEMAAFKKGLGYPVDTVTALRNMEGLSIKQAREKVKRLVMKCEEEAMAVADELMGPESTLPANMRRYVQGVYWAAGGANYWSATCLRYHSYERYNRYACILKRTEDLGKALIGGTAKILKRAVDCLSWKGSTANTFGLKREPESP